MEKKNNDDYIVRFNLIERIQHIVLFVSLIMLLLTGLSLAYYDSWFGKFMISLEGGLEGRGRLHNVPRCYIRYGDRIGQGKRCGFIHLGGQVDVYLPEHSRPVVSEGDWVRSGSDVLARLVHT